MGNFILFLNSFLSYLLLAVIIVAVATIGWNVGIRLRARKDAKEAFLKAQEAEATK